MEDGSEHEAEAQLLMHCATSLGVRSTLTPQASRTSGGAAHAGKRAIAVLGYSKATGRCDEGCGGGYVEGVLTVAASAYDVHEGSRSFNLQGVAAHGAGHAGDLVNGLALDAQAP